jgi:hypothetical protein
VSDPQPPNLDPSDTPRIALQQPATPARGRRPASAAATVACPDDWSYWQLKRQQGIWRFVLIHGALRSGLSVGLILALLRLLAWDHDALLMAGVIILLCPILSGFYFLMIWLIQERAYKTYRYTQSFAFPVILHAHPDDCGRQDRQS